jgi:hypothetical protein
MLPMALGGRRSPSVLPVGTARCDEVTRNAQPVIDQDAGLQLPREGEQLLRAPGGCALTTPNLTVMAVPV